MGLDLANIHSLSDFQRNVKKHIRRLKESGKRSEERRVGKECRL